MIQTERLNIYITTEEEMLRLTLAQTDEELIKAYKEMLQGCRDYPEQWAWYAVWKIELKDGTPVGDLSFKGLNDNGSVEIGYGIEEAYRCRGYAAEAVEAATVWALRQRGVRRVEAETEPGNKASQRVLEKCGFVPNGIIGEEGPRFVRDIRLETDRLIIDSLRESDKEDYFINISHDKKVQETFICNYAETLEDFDYSAPLANKSLYAIRLKETGKMIGLILTCEEKEDSCEIGYGLGSGYWHCGYATEAVRCFIDYLFNEKGYQTLYASFFTGNDASRHVMEKCGMTYSYFSEKELTYHGTEWDLTYYSINRGK